MSEQITDTKWVKKYAKLQLSEQNAKYKVSWTNYIFQRYWQIQNVLPIFYEIWISWKPSTENWNEVEVN